MIARAAALLALVLLGASCGATSERPSPAPTPPTSEALTRPLRFDYLTLDGKPLSTETVAGRFTLIGFLATYDVASQAEARFLGGLLRRHTPRINVAALVLESEENLPIVEAFAPSAAEVDQAGQIIVAAQDARWAPINHRHHGRDTLHDRASYRYFWQVLERADRTGQPLPGEIKRRFFTTV